MIITALDLEMNQPSNKIIQIGAVIGDLKTGEILSSLSLIINPHETLNPDIIKLTGILQEDVDAGTDLEIAYEALKNIHIGAKSFINPLTWGGGDSQFLRDQLKMNDEKWCFGRRWIDAKTVFISYCMANDLKFYGGLGKSLIKLGLKFDGQKHSALDDARNTFIIYRELLKRIKN